VRSGDTQELLRGKVLYLLGILKTPERYSEAVNRRRDNDIREQYTKTKTEVNTGAPERYGVFHSIYISTII
jgi:hypothetical protein